MFIVSIHLPKGKLLRKQLFSQYALAEAYFESLARVPQPQPVEIRLIEEKEDFTRYLLNWKQIAAAGSAARWGIYSSCCAAGA